MTTSLANTSTGMGIFANPESMEHYWRVAKLFAASRLVPDHLRGHTEDVMIALHLAARTNQDPLIVIQSIYFVSGKAGWSASYIIARANSSKVFRGRIQWRESGTGDDLEVTAYATLADTGEEISSTVGMRMAKAEGWTRNKKYSSMAGHMLRFRSATFLVRLYAPEVMLGMHTADELQDTSNGTGASVVVEVPQSPVIAQVHAPKVITVAPDIDPLTGVDCAPDPIAPEPAAVEHGSPSPSDLKTACHELEQRLTGEPNLKTRLNLPAIINVREECGIRQRADIRSTRYSAESMWAYRDALEQAVSDLGGEE